MTKPQIFGPFLAILVAVLIFVLSIIPTDISGSPPSFYFPGMDKFIHAIMYGTLTFVILQIILRQEKVRITAYFIWIPVILAYSILMEVIQFEFLDYRSGDFKDVIANASGIILALIISLAIRRLRS